MMSRVKVYSSATYHIVLAKFGELPMKLYALKLTKDFQQQLAHLLSYWVVNRATSLPNTLPNKNLTPGTNQLPC